MTGLYTLAQETLLKTQGPRVDQEKLTPNGHRLIQLVMNMIWGLDLGAAIVLEVSMKKIQ